MNTFLSDAKYTNISFTFAAHSSDGSLEGSLERFTALMTALFAWISLQLSIADVAADLIIETRVLVRELTALARLLIVICRRIVAVMDWCEDCLLVMQLGWQQIGEDWTMFWIKQGWNYAT